MPGQRSYRREQQTSESGVLESSTGWVFQSWGRWTVFASRDRWTVALVSRFIRS